MLYQIKMFYYDQEEKLTSMIEYHDIRRGSSILEIDTSLTLYEYDGENNLITDKYIRVSNNNRPLLRYDYKYDTLGRLVEKADFYSPKWKGPYSDDTALYLGRFERFKYIESGKKNITYLIFPPTGISDTVDMFHPIKNGYFESTGDSWLKYDDRDFRIEEFIKSTSEIIKYSYLFNEDGNPIERYSMREGGEEYILDKYRYEYFK